MEIINHKVKHKAFGEGTITASEEGRIEIDFGAKGKKIFQFPKAFEGFLKFVDAEAQAEVESMIVAIKEEERRLAAERAAAEAARLEALRQQAAAAKTSAKAAFVPRKRAHGEPFTYLVFQGGTFDEERAGEFLWAPIQAADGSTCHHWESLTEVQEGDVVFHCADGYIRAISFAKGRRYDSERPGSEFSEWDKKGRKIDCEYHILSNPIKHGDYKDEIIQMRDAKYGPFDKDGSGNLGYLFRLNSALAKFFLTEIDKTNLEIKALDRLNFLYA